MDVQYGPNKGSINIKPLEFGVVVSTNVDMGKDKHPGFVFTDFNELVKHLEHFLLSQDAPRKGSK